MHSLRLLTCLLSLGIGVPAVHADVNASFAEALNLFQAQKLVEAQAAFGELIKAEPTNPQYSYHLGLIALQRDDVETAVAWLEKTVSLDRTQSNYYKALGEAYSIILQRASILSKRGWAKKCLTAYDRGVALDPDNLEVRRARLRFYWNAPSIAGGGKDKAYAEAAEIQRRDPPRGAVVLSELYIDEEKFSDAFKLIDDTIAKNPNNKALLYQLGRLAAKSGQQLDRGEAALKEYLQHTPLPKEPSLHEAHWRLGTLYKKKGDKAAARLEYETALQLNSGFLQARESLDNLK